MLRPDSHNQLVTEAGGPEYLIKTGRVRGGKSYSPREVKVDVHAYIFNVKTFIKFLDDQGQSGWAHGLQQGRRSRSCLDGMQN